MDTNSDAIIMWKPTRAESDTNIGRFIRRVNETHNTNIDSYAQLHKWSISEVSSFWESVWQFCGIVSSQPFSKAIDPTLQMPNVPTWFEGAMLNYAEHALRWNDDRVAIYAAVEGVDEIKCVTYKELSTLVATYASALRRSGVTTGDRIVGYIPNCIEAVAAMLATSSIGAIWSSTSPDFGVSGVLDRFSQIAPKLIFSVNCVRYNGKLHSHMDKLAQVVHGLSDLQKVVIIKYVQDEVDISSIRNSVWLDEFLDPGQGDTVTSLTFEQLPFHHPLFVMYSSGTTGIPKCMVHSQGGTLIKHLEEHILQGNCSRDDIMLYYTTTGWMMWNWLVSMLTVGATVVLYDGSPLIPNPNVLWDLVDRLGITILGTGAKLLSILEERGIKPAETHSLTSLHTILSTGSPLKPESYDYVYRDVKSNALLGSITGGTDIIGCFAGQNWTRPVHRGEIQSWHLGCDMHCWSEEGDSVVGERGELICTRPFPSMPVFFWNDPDGVKYQKAYFSKFKGVWAHGDFCLINPRTGGIWMLGRSDGTLNPNGVRFGSAEIYNIVEGFKEIQDCVCVAQRKADNTEERVVLFIKMAVDCQFNEDLLKRIKAAVRELLSARHVPEIILETKDIPYTVNGKKVEVAVRDTIAGEAVHHKAALANPDALALYSNIPELQNY